MKILFIAFILLAGGVLFAFRGRFMSPGKLVAMKEISFYDLSVGGLQGGTINMSDFKGKYVLCVNVASKCGHTPQYKGLQELYTTYKDKLVIVGFPCNQFLFQEPGKPEDIADFCELNYGVTFPLTEKIDVKGKDTHPVYQWLTMKSLNGVADTDVKWNFQKFLISPEGKWLKSFAPATDPLSKEITSQLN